MLPRKLRRLVKRVQASRDRTSLPPHPGPSYRAVLKALFDTGRYQTYLEIGSATGGTLALATGSVIAVDPQFRLTRNVMPGKAALHAFQTTSDAFFAEQDPSALFMGRPLDLVFLDGMHLFEFLLRDFINTERVSHPGTLILMHDGLPLNAAMTSRQIKKDGRRRDRYYEWWTGDVWKILPILAEHRPDLSVACLDAPPTGLIAVTGLDPASTVLADRYEQTVAGLTEQTLDDDGIRALHQRHPPRPAAAALADLGHAIGVPQGG